MDDGRIGTMTVLDSEERERCAIYLFVPFFKLFFYMSYMYISILNAWASCYFVPSKSEGVVYRLRLTLWKIDFENQL